MACPGALKDIMARVTSDRRGGPLCHAPLDPQPNRLPFVLSCTASTAPCTLSLTHTHTHTHTHAHMHGHTHTVHTGPRRQGHALGDRSERDGERGKEEEERRTEVERGLADPESGGICLGPWPAF